MRRRGHLGHGPQGLLRGTLAIVATKKTGTAKKQTRKRATPTRTTPKRTPTGKKATKAVPRKRVARTTKSKRERVQHQTPGPYDDWIRQTDRFASIIMAIDRIGRAGIDEDDDEYDTYKFHGDPRSVEQRFDELGVFEMALQHYVMENPGDLGFEGARGPFPTGPDLHIQIEGRWAKAEVEVDAANYIKHGHHKDPKFTAVRFLIVPDQKIAPTLRLRLPKNIVFIKREPFVKWYAPRRHERRFDRSPNLREQILGAAYADLHHRMENSYVSTLTCEPCGIRAIYRVEEHEPGFRDPTDREDLQCPKCKAVLANVKAVGATFVRAEPIGSG